MAAAALVIVGVDFAMVRAWHTHDAELHELWGLATRALDRAGIRGKVVVEGFDDGGAGSSDCGAHIVLVLTTELRPGVVSSRLRHVLFPGVVYADKEHLVAVAWEPVETGADTILDMGRCRGPIPYENASPLR